MIVSVIWLCGDGYIVTSEAETGVGIIWYKLWCEYMYFQSVLRMIGWKKYEDRSNMNLSSCCESIEWQLEIRQNHLRFRTFHEKSHKENMIAELRVCIVFVFVNRTDNVLGCVLSCNILRYDA